MRPILQLRKFRFPNISEVGIGDLEFVSRQSDFRVCSLQPWHGKPNNTHLKLWVTSSPQSKRHKLLANWEREFWWMSLQINGSQLGVRFSPWTFGKVWRHFWLSKLEGLLTSMGWHQGATKYLRMYRTVSSTSPPNKLKNYSVQNVLRLRNFSVDDIFRPSLMKFLLVVEMCFFKFYSMKLSCVGTPDDSNLIFRECWCYPWKHLILLVK